MIKNEGEDFYFSTGRVICANKGIIGLNPNLETYEGYDAPLFLYGIQLDQQERIELADYMISLWTKYKEQDDSEK